MRASEFLTESYPTVRMTLEQFLTEEPVKSSWIADLTYDEEEEMWNFKEQNIYNLNI